MTPHIHAYRHFTFTNCNVNTCTHTHTHMHMFQTDTKMKVRIHTQNPWTHIQAQFLCKRTHCSLQRTMKFRMSARCSLSWGPASWNIISSESRWMQRQSVALHPVIVTSTKLPNQPPPAFLLSLFTFTYYLPDNSSSLRRTIGNKLHLALYRPIWSLRVTKANTLYESLSHRQRDYSPRNLYFIQRLHFPQSDHDTSDGSEYKFY